MALNMSSINEKFISKEEENVQIFANQMLRSRLFIGNFQEKRYVDSLKSYRDVIFVISDESELIRDLEVVRKRLHGFYGKDHWIGITTPNTIGAPAGYSLWVELSEEVFGSYWYRISKIRFRSNETLLRLKVIRPVSSNVSNNSIGNQTVSDITNNTYDLINEIDLNNVFNSLRNIGVAWVSFFNSVLTMQNTKDAIKFFSIFIVAVFSGMIHFVEFMSNFLIKFMQELSRFVQVATPIIIAMITLVSKTIGGFYLLILDMWRHRNGPPVVYPVMYPNVAYSGSQNVLFNRRALPSIPDRYSRKAKVVELK